MGEVLKTEVSESSGKAFLIFVSLTWLSWKELFFKIQTIAALWEFIFPNLGLVKVVATGPSFTSTMCFHHHPEWGCPILSNSWKVVSRTTHLNILWPFYCPSFTSVFCKLVPSFPLLCFRREQNILIYYYYSTNENWRHGTVRLPGRRTRVSLQ